MYQKTSTKSIHCKTKLASNYMNIITHSYKIQATFKEFGSDILVFKDEWITYVLQLVNLKYKNKKSLKLILMQLLNW